MNAFKKRLKEGALLIGSHVSLIDSSIIEIIGHAGYDYVWIDTEHSTIDYQTLQAHIIAAKAAGIASIVRVPWNEPYLAKRVLEIGPDGIIFPMINSADEAKQAMDTCIYPPNGKRGFGPVRAIQYGHQQVDDYISESSDSFCRFIQIEHKSAIDNLDQILQVPYIDGLIIGPCDLSASIGELNCIYGEKTSIMIDEIVKKAKAALMPIGLSTGATGEMDIQYWKDKGIQFLSAGGDYHFLTIMADEVEKRLRKLFCGQEIINN